MEPLNPSVQQKVLGEKDPNDAERWVVAEECLGVDEVH